jgi:hypothetical protein
MFRTNPSKTINFSFISFIAEKMSSAVLWRQWSTLHRSCHAVQNATYWLSVYESLRKRRLVEEIQVNLVYRLFVGLSLTDPVPHPSTFSQNRRRRFQQSTIYQEIYDEIVLQAIRHGFIEGKPLFTDSTFLKANATKASSKNKKSL